MATVIQIVYFNDDAIVFHLCYVNNIMTVYITMTSMNTHP